MIAIQNYFTNKNQLLFISQEKKKYTEKNAFWGAHFNFL